MKNEITYTEINGINYPNLALPEQPKVNIGKYGQIRLGFIKKHRRGTYTTESTLHLFIYIYFHYHTPTVSRGGIN